MRRTILIRLVLCLGILVFSLVSTVPISAIVSCPTTECSTVIPNCNSCGGFFPIQQESCLDSNGNTRTRWLFVCCTYPTGPKGYCVN